MAIFNKIRDRLTRSRETVATRVDQLVHSYRAIEDEFYEDLSDVLILADAIRALKDKAHG